jgi:hypothetical protein
MAGVFTRANLAFLQLAASKGDIYAPVAKNGLVHNVIIHNSNTTTESVVLNYYGASELQIFKMDVLAGETKIIDFGNEGLVVMDGHKITGNTTTASKVTIKIDGTEEV